MRVRNGHWIALTLLLVLAAAFLYRETRGTTLWFDEWSWALRRRGSGLDTFLDPHNGHLSLVPVSIYKALFAIAGLTDYRPYRVLVIAAHLGCVVLVFLYARKRVGDFAGVLAAILILLLGPGWQNFLWPFQIAWLIVARRRARRADGARPRDRRGRPDRVRVARALARELRARAARSRSGRSSTSAGRRRLARRLDRRRAAALYVPWWMRLPDTALIRHKIVIAPDFVADSAAGPMSALTGLDRGADRAGSAGALPLGSAARGRRAAALLAWRLARSCDRSRAGRALLTILLSFWALTALRRAGSSVGNESRYVYVGAFFGLA